MEVSKQYLLDMSNARQQGARCGSEDSGDCIARLLHPLKHSWVDSRRGLLLTVGKGLNPPSEYFRTSRNGESAIW